MATVTARGIEPVVTRVRGMADRAARPSNQVWEDIGRMIRNAYKEQFETEGAFLGRKWAPLNPRYAAWKQRHHPEGTILVLEGKLKESYTDAQKAYTHITGNVGEFGSNDKIAKYHQYGTRFMPARRVVVVNMFLRNEIKRVERDYVMGRRP